MPSATQAEPRSTVLHAWHVAAGASMHEFGGYDMPIHYDSILTEHLSTRARAGLFDISHMGRFRVGGRQAMPFLRHALTNDAARLRADGEAQYTLLADDDGGARDDAFLYQMGQEEFLLVVNAANRDPDWTWLGELARGFPGLELRDQSEELAMMALQGPAAQRALRSLLVRHGGGELPGPGRNAVSRIQVDGSSVIVARTGYTGEPLSFELFPLAGRAVQLWERLLSGEPGEAVVPVGLGARDTLRLEAGLPLYGHELGQGPDGKPVPIMALRGIAARGVDLSDPGRAFVGRDALQRQQDELNARREGKLRGGGADGDTDAPRLVPHFVRRLAVLNAGGTGPGTNPVRSRHVVHHDGKPAGWVTSGTVVPYWKPQTPDGEISAGEPAASGRRAIALAYIRADVSVRRTGTPVDVDKGRGRLVPALLVRANLRVEGDHARALLHPASG